MSKTLYKLTIPLSLCGGLALCAWAALLGPAIPPVNPVSLVGTSVSFRAEAEGASLRSRDALPDAAELAAWFFRGATTSVKVAPAPGPKAVPKALATPVPVAAGPQIARDLSIIGPATVDGVAKWVLFDRQRNASFAIAPGETWAVWSCVKLGEAGLIMKRGDELYVVPVKK